MGAVQPWHIVIVVLVFLLLFGAKRLPEGARALGKSMRIFKSEIKEMQADGKPSADAGSDGRTDADGRPSPQSAPTPIASERVDAPPSAGSSAPRPTEHRSA